MEKLKFKKLMLEIGDDILKSSIESLSEQYGVPTSELKDLVTLSRLAGRLENTLEIEEMFLNDMKDLKETKED